MLMLRKKTEEDRISLYSKKVNGRDRKGEKRIVVCIPKLLKLCDTVNRKIMWEIFVKVGFNEHISNTIKSMYRDIMATY